MVKFMGIFRLKEEYASDESFKLWRDSHTKWAKKHLKPELKKYTIGRVIDSFGDAEIHGVSQIEFEDLASARRAMERLRASPPDEFLSRIAEVKRIVIEEESVEI
jgi:hypothetical protein